MNIFSKEHAGDTAVPVEEEISIAEMDDQQQTEKSVWEVIARWGLSLIIFLTPLWFLPLTINPVDGNKLFMVSILAIIGFVAWLGMAIYQGALRIPRSVLFYALGVWVIVYFLAALFSISPEISFWGTTATSFFSLLIGALVALIVAVTFRTSDHVHHAYKLLFIATGIAALFMIIQTLLSIDIFPWDFAKLRTFHPIGSWNTIGLFFGFVLVNIVTFLSSGTNNLSRTTHSLFVGLAIVSLILAAVVNFRMLWIGVGITSIVFLAYHFSRPGDRASRMRVMAMPLVLLLVSVWLYLAHSMISTLTLNINPPLDVTPTISSSLQIAGEVLREDPLLGVGPNMFGHAWDQYKDPAVNNTIFWRLRFGTASSFVSTLLTTTGILGILSFLMFFGAVLWTGLSFLSKLKWDEFEHRLLGSIFFSLLFLLFAWFVYPFTVTISILTFFMVGLMVAQMHVLGMGSFSQISIQADSTKGFVAALVIIFLMVFGVVGLYVTSQKHVAAIVYGRGVLAFNERESINEAENLFRRAAEFDGSRDLYFRAIAEMSAIKLQRSITDIEGKQPEDVRSAFQVALSSAIAAAQSATQVDAGNAVNWRLLGQIYESVIPFVGGSAEAALEAYLQAVKQSPRDPVLRDDLARAYIALGNHLQARETLDEAIKLKPDYAAAHFRLAQIASIKGNLGEAISNTERAALSAPRDVGILFQLGVLYYQQNRYRDAQQVLELVVKENSNYSNARYFLGLAYAEQGERQLAIEQFMNIAELNPNNVELSMIIANLRDGRDALDGVSPPPLSREQLPVEKESEELEQSGELQDSIFEESGNENVDGASAE